MPDTYNYFTVIGFKGARKLPTCVVESVKFIIHAHEE
jgi:hypothetical protein